MTDDCRSWRGDLAARALGREADVRSPGFDAHLDGCAECRAELDELRAVAGTVALADPDRLDPAAVDPRIGDRVLARVAAERRARRRRRVLTGAVAAALVVVALVAGVVVTGGGGAGGDDVELAGPGGATGTATLTAKPWGTELQVDLVGLDAGEMYWLWVSGDDGDRVVAGSIAGTGRTVHAVLAAAMPADDATRVWITDTADQVVLDTTG